MAAQALRDLKILDLTRVIAGASGTQFLSDFGATVWKVEDRAGDETRTYRKDGAAMFNRSKQALVVDYSDPRGQAIIKGLAARADIAAENSRPGGLKKHNLHFGDLVEEFPRLIAVSVSGFGQTGPWADALGYDMVVQATTGQMYTSGVPGDPPIRLGVFINDLMAGMGAATAIMIALHERQLSGRGQWIDLSLYDFGLYSLATTADEFMNFGVPVIRGGAGHPFKVPVQPFDAQDGPIMIAVGNDGQFQRMCKAMELHDLAKDGRFIKNDDRRANLAELEKILSAEFIKKPVQYWMDLFIPSKVPAGPLNDVGGMMTNAQTRARAMVVDTETEFGSTTKVMGNPLQHFSRTPPQMKRPPRHGEHTRQILREELAMLDGDIDALIAADVIMAEDTRQMAVGAE
ncbi:CaiB/BaiF CoA transferase family protein [Mameliella sediminis]|uniref:CaiB/BaiF CoA transferase family protein n=1 Tax=Mameliella sediminis TaxID=2836866 RepID=UPI001C48047C|nr:CoA transferase [Mameliella sediminis]MBY6116133.1 CoA transferase [Antarctobacter heliothermus]MBY6146098.1 CoA transferase [Mameliella alba]MBV7396908.1 CoA transferase [Mameliella sediminis]MBY6161803.1 CoA transferase [Mameliella alba]MBY6170273.1 CoA transferase [Mameliella alba]